MSDDQIAGTASDMLKCLGRAPNADGMAKITVQCGECGCSVNLRKNKVRSAQYYLCGSKEHGHLCEAKLPPLPPGMVVASKLMPLRIFGVTPMNGLMPKRLLHFNEREAVLAAGVAQLAIEKAREGR